MAELTLDEARPALQQAYAEQRLIPFLGAGFSAPLALPSWKELIRWMSAHLDFDPDLFELHGRPEQLAGFFERARDPDLRDFVAEMKARFHAPEIEARRAASVQHQALARRAFPTIYTTNYERHIERALRDAGRDAMTLATLADFQRALPRGTCQVIKFHGDLEHPETVVLTEAHFFDRMKLDAAPDQRLRADLLGNAFIFLGYSFNDVNLRYIWHRMNRLRRESGARGPVPAERRAYWATFGAGLVQPSLLEAWDIDVITLDPTNKSQSVVDLLDALAP
ncbi:MAG: SIR2 family protein [Minicystis sp.]